tara:strand:- start:3488 stop:4216 length:729 start_codon:yes stop_codon:yes gene_type:complete
MVKTKRIESFSFKPGHIIEKKFKITKKLGGGYESEVYQVKELLTGVNHAAKFFFPHRNIANKAIKFHAKKLHKLKSCPVLIKYLTAETMEYEGREITYLVSEYVEGEVLEDFINHHPGKRLSPFQALHLLYAIVKGVEDIHRNKDYHGDLHTGNIIVQRHGLNFDIKIMDMYHWGTASKENYQHDLVSMIHILYDAIGGQKNYHKMPPAIKEIVCGLKTSLIIKKFKNVLRLKSHLENMSWE